MLFVFTLMSVVHNSAATNLDQGTLIFVDQGAVATHAFIFIVNNVIEPEVEKLSILLKIKCQTLPPPLNCETVCFFLQRKLTIK